jgi:hypothetical protein
MGSGCVVLTQLALHYLQPELKPLDEAMSYYVYGRQGWLLTLGLFSLGVGSLVLTIVLAWGPAATVSRGGLLCLAIWSAGVLFGAAFAADPPGRWDKPPSISGSIHGIAAMVALVSFPVAAVLLSRGFRSDSRWIGRSRILGTLAIASGVSLLLFFASLAPVFVRPGPPILLGLTERLLFAVYLAWLWGCAAGVLGVSAAGIVVAPGGHSAK